MLAIVIISLYMIAEKLRVDLCRIEKKIDILEIKIYDTENRIIKKIS
jgi:hypothetical protein